MNGNIRYLLTCEYGSDRRYIDRHGRKRTATHRPHYHVIWFITTPYINRWLFRHICHMSWYGGISEDSEINNGFVIGTGAIKYVTKYVCKDVYDDDNFFEVYKTLDKDDKEEFDKNKPFIRLSSYLGACAFDTNNDNTLVFSDYVKTDLLTDGYILCDDKKYGKKKYKLPMYFERMIFYDKFVNFDEENNHQKGYLYYLNELGREVRKKRFAKYVQAVHNDILSASAIPFNDHDKVLTSVNSTFVKDFHCVNDIRNYLLDHLDTSHLASSAHLVYSNYECLQLLKDTFTNFNPHEDYNILYSIDRFQNLDDFSHDFGCTFNDLLTSIHSNISYYQHTFKNDAYDIAQHLIKLKGDEKEAEHLKLERDARERAEYKKRQTKKVNYANKFKHPSLRSS